MPGSLNFGQHFFNLSHETVPLCDEIRLKDIVQPKKRAVKGVPLESLVLISSSEDLKCAVFN